LDILLEIRNWKLEIIKRHFVIYMSELIKNFKQLILFSVFLFLCFLVFLPLSHAADISFQPQVPIPGFNGGSISPTSIGMYIKAIYKYAIGIVGILAAVVLMFGGLLWLTAGGNTNQVGEAKAWIGASLTGLLIALCSFMIMATINPKLVEVGSIDPGTITAIPLQQSTNQIKTNTTEGLKTCTGTPLQQIGATNLLTVCMQNCRANSQGMSYESFYMGEGNTKTGYCCICN